MDKTIPLLIFDWNSSQKFIESFYEQDDADAKAAKNLVPKSGKCMLRNGKKLIAVSDKVAGLLSKTYPRNDIKVSELLTACNIESTPEGYNHITSTIKIALASMETRPVYIVSDSAIIRGVSKKFKIICLCLTEADKMIDFL